MKFNKCTIDVKMRVSMLVSTCISAMAVAKAVC